MDRDDVKAFIDRDRARVDASRRRFWAKRRADHGPAATVVASEALRRHMRTVRDDWPSREQREADLAHHVAWTGLLERIGGAIADR